MSVITVASDAYADYEDDFESDELYVLLQDDFDPARFYKSLSQALDVLEGIKENAA